jgi:homoserine kinase
LLGTNALLDQPFSNREILDMAAAIEGHPDNVAPALLGGLVIAIQNTSPPGAHEPVRITARRVPTARLFVAVAVPEMSLATRAARAALPARVPIADAVFNIGRASLVVEALRLGDMELLGEAMQDRLHQPYRLKLIPGAEPAMQAARLAGAGAAALSGAGPGVVAFAQEDAAEIASAMVAAFEAAGLKARSWALAVAQNGASVAL